jgi:hypothetical protein
MASDNHVCNPICADLPIAAINNNKINMSIKEFFTVKAKINSKLKLPYNKNIIHILAYKPKSPNLLTIIALIAALLA